MFSQNFNISSKELKTRKIWILLTFVSYFVLPVISAGVFIGVWKVSISMLPADSNAMSLIKLLYGVILGACAFSVIVFFLLWCCSYKKPGTRFLSVYLVVTAIFSGLGVLFQASLPLAKVSLLSILSIALFVWWFVVSLQVRKINKKIQLEESKTTEVTSS